MPIAKKFGKTNASTEKRTLTLKPTQQETVEVQAFLLKNPDAVIGQWASAMDKIASKPKSHGKPTEHERKFRERLGQAIWNDLTSLGPLKDIERKSLEALKTKWFRRVHPYQDGTFRPKDGQKTPSAKGRMYIRFAGEIGTGNAKVDEIARKIRFHLEKQEFQKHENGLRNAGRATRRASSIARNTLFRADQNRKQGQHFDLSELSHFKDDYCDSGDPIEAIYREAKKREEEEKGHRVTWSLAAKQLFDHYATVFRNGRGDIMSFKEAEVSDPELIALHRLIENYYRDLLKRHKKDKEDHFVNIGNPSSEGGFEVVKRRKNISLLMPRNFDELQAKIAVRKSNKDVMSLIRRGRIIHYQIGSNSHGDGTSEVSNSSLWEGALAQPFFWTTEGQIEIKRAESFVRAWRNFASHGSRTLTDWIRPEIGTDDAEGDITSVFPDNPKPDGPDKLTPLSEETINRTAVLFGTRAGVFGQDEELVDSIRSLGTVFSQVRHNSFHFRGMQGFVKPLLNLSSLGGVSTEALHRFHELHSQDREVAHHRIKDELRAAHVEHFLTAPRLKQLWSGIQGLRGSETHAGRPVSPVTLPRFTRVVKRNANTWGNRNKNLPRPVNKEAMKRPEVHFHYSVAKLLYSRGFRQWISEAKSEQINGWIKTATDRAQEAAQELSGEETAVARMVGQIEVPEGQNIRRFFDDLVGLTATEFRVQKGYESDGEAARKQAAFLENLNCDVMALAFNQFLADQDFSCLATVARPENYQARPLSSIDELNSTLTEENFEDWEVALYAVLHLVPVGEVAKLQHQLRRWANKPKDEPVEVPLQSKLEALFALYIDCHDEKFDGGTPLQDNVHLQEFFAGTKADMVRGKILPQSTEATRDQSKDLVPLRQLREMLRFGNAQKIGPFCKDVPITWEVYQDWQKLENGDAQTNPIAKAQAIRTELHDKLSKKNGDAQDLARYTKALGAIIAHRRLSNHANLINHVRLNGLMMSLLARFADIAGIWERDVYFCCLALIEERRKTPADIFSERGLRMLQQGRIMQAIDGIQNSNADGKAIKDRLQRIFRITDPDQNKHCRKIRNSFAHFSMLQTKAGEDYAGFDVTDLMNKARQLLAYDRKMKNAVVSSINTLFERENIEVYWQMGKDHKLHEPMVKSKMIRHLKDSHVAKKVPAAQLSENLRDGRILQMVAALVGGHVANEVPDALLSP